MKTHAEGPRDSRGHFISRDCPECGSGRLQPDEPQGWWRCDGLAAPDRDDQPLYACTYSHEDGTDPWPPNPPHR